MSFASSAREEIARLPLGEPCCAAAEAAGMLSAGGVISFSSAGRSVYVQSDQASIARRAFSLLKHAFRSRAELRTYLGSARGSQPAYRVLLRGEDAERVLSAAGLEGLALDAQVPKELTRKICCQRAFLRGAFLVSGTLGAPSKGYHMEWRLTRLACAQGIRRMLAKEEIPAGIAERRDRYVVYIKDAERISDALALMGAVEALLELENVRVVKELRNRVNRQVNCESANVDKATAAAYRQIEAIEYLEGRRLLRRLSPQLRETAEARLEHPEATLEELGALLAPPQGKSAVNHRLRRLQTIAREDKESSMPDGATNNEN